MTADDQALIARQQLPTANEPTLWASGTPTAACPTDGHCVTCSDEALPARVLHIDGETGLAVVDVNGNRSEVDVTLVDEVRMGQLLLVHGGVAIASLEEA